MQYVSQSIKETQKIASDLAQKIIKSDKHIIGLEGELGAGKTTFIRGFIRSLGIKGRVQSPTFLLIKEYATPKSAKCLVHIDCYRINDPQELESLEIKQILNNKNNIVLIEWPERIAKILPKDTIRVHIDHVNQNTRKININ